MFIELTDHLRCTELHEERFLVLLPTRMTGRTVQAGELGCPVCGRVISIEDGVVDFGDAPTWSETTGLSADAVVTLLGIEGPGGYVALVGGSAALADELLVRLPGVHFVLVNPEPGQSGPDGATVVRAPTLPVKAGSMRGAVLGKAAGGRDDWITRAAGALLSGRRMVVEGPAPDRVDLEVLASAPGIWVGGRSGVPRG